MAKFLSDSDKEFIWNNSSTTLTYMTENKVVPSPQNYQLWYTYSAQSDLNLSRVMESMVAKKIPFNEEVNEKLYERFFSADKEMKSIVENGATFQWELAKIITVLRETGEDSSEHTQALMQHMDKLSDFEGSNELKDIIRVVISDTDKIKEQSQKLENKLKESSGKIEGLKTNLDNARLESRTDALTNIGNRKFFEEKMEEYMNSYKKQGS